MYLGAVSMQKKIVQMRRSNCKEIKAVRVKRYEGGPSPRKKIAPNPNGLGAILALMTVILIQIFATGANNKLISKESTGHKTFLK